MWDRVFEGWRLFSVNKKESLVDILKGYTEEEVRKAIPKAFDYLHVAYNPGKCAPIDGITKEKKARKGRAIDRWLDGE